MREIEMFLLMNMDSPLSRDRCMKLIQKNVNERVVEELELVYSSIYKTMNRIEIVISSTKTIDMNKNEL